MDNILKIATESIATETIVTDSYVRFVVDNNQIPKSAPLWFLCLPLLINFLGIIANVIINYFNRKNSSAIELKSKNRIYWIEDVRKLTSDLISIYYELLSFYKFNTKTNEDLYLKLCEARKYTDLLILNFSIDDDNKKDDKEDGNILDNRYINNGKNQHMARFIEDIFNSFYNYYSVKNNIDDCIDNYNKNVDEAEKIYDADFEWQTYQEYDDEGRKYEVTELLPINDYDSIQEHIEKASKLKSKLEELKKAKKDLESKLFLLRDRIRIYLKIEWDKAKDNKS